jgi:hypothetical protein
MREIPLDRQIREMWKSFPLGWVCHAELSYVRRHSVYALLGRVSKTRAVNRVSPMQGANGKDSCGTLELRIPVRVLSIGHETRCATVAMERHFVKTPSDG